MYIKRWLEVASQRQDGTLKTKEGKGTPQGGVIRVSPKMFSSGQDGVKKNILG